jgi:hypothetical protein
MVNEPEARFETLPNTKVIQHALCQDQNVHPGADSIEKPQRGLFCP